LGLALWGCTWRRGVESDADTGVYGAASHVLGIQAGAVDVAHFNTLSVGLITLILRSAETGMMPAIVAMAQTAMLIWHKFKGDGLLCRNVTSKSATQQRDDCVKAAEVAIRQSAGMAKFERICLNIHIFCRRSLP